MCSESEGNFSQRIVRFRNIKKFLCNFDKQALNRFGINIFNKQTFKPIIMLKNYCVTLILSASMLTACMQEKPQDERVEEKTDKLIMEEITTPEEIIPDVIKVFSLKDYEGKYAKQEKLFETDPLASRLKALNGLNYEVFMAFWNTETPVKIENNVVHMSGCKQHACSESAYDFFMDLENDNINIYHFRNNTMRIYQEKGWIDLPPTLASEIEIKKSNAQIGM